MVNTTTRSKMLLWLANWLDDSPMKKLLVAGAATSYSTSAPVMIEQILGTFAGSTMSGNRVLMPYFPITIELSNPTGQRTSLSHCALTLEFYQRQGTHESMGYMAPQTLVANAFKQSPVILVESGETKDVELLFFFLPTPDFEPLLNDKTTQPHRFRVACNNESGGRIESPVS